MVIQSGYISELIDTYEKYKSDAKEINIRLKSLRNGFLRYVNVREIVSLDGRISALSHDTLTFIINLQAKIDDGVNNDTKDLEILHGNLSRLLDFLTSLHRLNTHLYIAFSGGFAIGVAFLSLALGILSLALGILSLR